jgi:hypothetical protein
MVVVIMKREWFNVLTIFMHTTPVSATAAQLPFQTKSPLNVLQCSHHVSSLFKHL